MGCRTDTGLRESGSERASLLAAPNGTLLRHGREAPCLGLPAKAPPADRAAKENML